MRRSFACATSLMATVVKDTTVYEYTGGDILDYTTTYKAEVPRHPERRKACLLKTYTKYFGLVKGEEIADYSFSYSGTSGDEYEYTTTVYFYGLNHGRADSILSGDNVVLSATSVYYNAHSGAVYSDETELKSRTRSISRVQGR